MDTNGATHTAPHLALPLDLSQCQPQARQPDMQPAARSPCCRMAQKESAPTAPAAPSKSAALQAPMLAEPWKKGTKPSGRAGSCVVVPSLPFKKERKCRSFARALLDTRSAANGRKETEVARPPRQASAGVPAVRGRVEKWTLGRASSSPGSRERVQLQPTQTTLRPGRGLSEFCPHESVQSACSSKEKPFFREGKGHKLYQSDSVI